MMLRNEVNDQAMLVAAGCDDHGAGPSSISRLRVLKMVGRRSLKSLPRAAVRVALARLGI